MAVQFNGNLLQAIRPGWGYDPPYIPIFINELTKVVNQLALVTNVCALRCI
jgi:hypothetical protein